MKIAACVFLLAAPALALQGGYLSQMGGGGAVKPSSIKTVTSGRPAFGGTYLDQMARNAPSAPVARAAPAAPAASAASFSLSQVAANASPVPVGDYLSSLKGAGAPSGSGPRGYLDTLRIQAAATAATNLPGYLDTLRVGSAISGTGPRTYLDNIAGAASVTAKVEATTAFTLTSNEPILAAINRMNENMKKNQKLTIEILQDINTSVKKLVIRADNVPAAPRVAETTELVTALEASAAPTAGGYLASLKVQSARAPSGRGIGGYLDNL